MKNQHQDLVQALQAFCESLEFFLSPAELQGYLVAFLCCHSGTDASADEATAWLADFLQLDVSGLDSSENGASYRKLHEVTRAMLRSDQYDFEPLLPDDNHPLAERTRALGDFCQGFITGLSLWGVKVEAVSADAQSCHEDLVAIGQVDTTDAEEAPEDSERQLLELVEHTRLAVMLLYRELGGDLEPSEIAGVH